MAYTNPVVTASAGDILTATNWNTYIRDNEAFLFSGKAVATVNYDAGTPTTTSTTFADIDATNLIATITVASGRARVYVQGYAAASNFASESQYDIAADGTRAGSTNGLVNVQGNTQRNISMEWIFTGLSVGSHTFSIQYRSANASLTAYWHADVSGASSPTQIIAEEL